MAYMTEIASAMYVPQLEEQRNYCARPSDTYTQIERIHMDMKVFNSHSRCEQSCPVHPVEQEHLLGAVHRPFTHDGEQIAAVKQRQGMRT